MLLGAAVVAGSGSGMGLKSETRALKSNSLCLPPRVAPSNSSSALLLFKKRTIECLKTQSLPLLQSCYRFTSTKAS